MSFEVVLAAMLAQKQAWVDRQETAEQRVELLEPRARIIDEEAHSLEAKSAVVTLGYAETKWARAVLEGHCSRMPAGQRCDNGLARGAFELHQRACREAWALPEGGLESFRWEVRCAVRQLYAAHHRCRAGWAGAFSGYGGAGCYWAAAYDRELKMRGVLWFMAQREQDRAKPEVASAARRSLAPSPQLTGETQDD